MADYLGSKVHMIEDVHVEAAAIKVCQVPGQHPEEDRGEVATVFYAAQRCAEGEKFSVLTDDHFGRRLARDRGLGLLTTPELVLGMVDDGALPTKDGERVWRECTPRKAWSSFKERVSSLSAAGR